MLEFLKRLWRFSLKTVIFAVTTVLVLAGLYLAFNWYSGRPTEAKTWPVDDFESVGVKVYLKTEWFEGFIHYQMHVVPFAPEYAKSFSRVAQGRQSTNNFSIDFLDKDGFDLSCNIVATEFVNNLETDGSIQALSVQGSVPCVRSKYLSASRIDVTTTFTKVEKEVVIVPDPPARDPIVILPTAISRTTKADASSVPRYEPGCPRAADQNCE